MQVFELHFNQKQREDVIYDSFCYEPENVYEKRLGNLYVVGKVDNVAGTNSLFLENLARILKDKYYSYLTRPAVSALRAALKEGNKFLAELVKKGNISWLGNLELAIFTIKESPQKRGISFSFNFTKSGEIKMFLLRESALLEIGQELKFQDLEPYPFKIFFNVASGRLKEKDRLLIANQDLLEKRKNFIKRLVALKNFEEKKIKELLQLEREDPADDFGICFLASLTREARSSRSLAVEKVQPRLSLFSIFSMSRVKLEKFAAIFVWLNPVKSAKGGAAKPQFNRVNHLLAELISPVRKVMVKSGKMASGLFFFKKNRPDAILLQKQGPVRNQRFLTGLLLSVKKNLLLLGFFILVLLLGFFIFQRERAKLVKETQNFLAEIDSKVYQAKGLLTLGEKDKANFLFQDAWQGISKKGKQPFVFKQRSAEVKNLIEQNLIELNNLEKLKEPEPVFQYAGREEIIGPFFNQAIFKFSEQDMAIYFLESKSGEIIKYPYNLSSGWAEPEQWLKQEPPTNPPHASIWGVVGGKSIAIDGSVWVLAQDNLIHRFYSGKYQETIDLKIFPFLKNPISIWTLPEYSYLYLLEPSQNRLLVLSKDGHLLKQFQSEKFNNLLDFKISADEKTIWLLSGLKVYLVSNELD